MGLGNTLILPALIGATLSGVQPQQAGVASGTLNTTQQFAGSAGLAIVGTIFFNALGDHSSGAADYASATETAAWISVALVAAMAALTGGLGRHTHPTAPAATRETVTTAKR
jgi:hypothetical protein